MTTDHRMNAFGPIQYRCRRGSSGFSLIELMIAMVLGLLVAEGIYLLFASNSRANAVQLALSRLQENGRIAIDTIAADLRLAGHMPCGSQRAPQVFTDALATHIVAASASASTPIGATADHPYLLDRGVYLSGNRCTESNCVPAMATALGVPRAGHAVGDRVPGTDVLTVRYLQADGFPASVNGAGGSCASGSPIASVGTSGLPASAFVAGHLAMLASCTNAQIFEAKLVGDALQPVVGKFGAPDCSEVGAQPRLFDFDASLQTSTYYLQVVQDETITTRKLASLMRRTNGVVNEIVQGVERFDLRYSLHDAGDSAYWLDAAHVDQGVSAVGGALLCGATASAHSCSWADVDAIDVAILVDTVDDMPIENSAGAWDYRYSIDGDAIQTPKAAMPTTGLTAGRMLRREFRTVVALRSMAP